MCSILRYATYALVGVLSMACTAPSIPFMSRCPSLSDAIASDTRTPRFVGRDAHRHPQSTLEFFDVEPDQTVVEIWPGGGWYTEILAPYLHRCGTLYVAGFDPSANEIPKYRARMHEQLLSKFDSLPEQYSRVIVTALHPPTSVAIAPPGRADRVLTFRNVHNWMKDGQAEAVFAAMFAALKPGGILGVVEHRAKPGTAVADMIQSGYVTEAQVMTYAKAAGFKLDARSQINANAKDTKDHAKGVWTLPPSLRLGKQDLGQYLAIGESDRMTLRFIKPK